MRQKMVMGNWKMNGAHHTIKQLLSTFLAELPSELDEQCVVFPPFVYLPFVLHLLEDRAIALGAQNVYPKEEGAYTGEISGPMLCDIHCQYVLVGHSERRHVFGESENFVAEKFHHVKEHAMIPVLCVGETLEDRQKGLTEHTLSHQLSAITAISGDFQGCIVAYEPVWAIGTGETATPDQAQAAHAFIRHWVTENSSTDASNLTILYGGSVNDKNAQSLFSMPDVDGGLVGGSSLRAAQFLEIVKCINYS